MLITYCFLKTKLEKQINMYISGVFYTKIYTHLLLAFNYFMGYFTFL